MPFCYEYFNSIEKSPLAPLFLERGTKSGVLKRVPTFSKGRFFRRDFSNLKLCSREVVERNKFVY